MENNDKSFNAFGFINSEFRKNFIVALIVTLFGLNIFLFLELRSEHNKHNKEVQILNEKITNCNEKRLDEIRQIYEKAIDFTDSVKTKIKLRQ
jgi:hypothetical protein